MRARLRLLPALLLVWMAMPCAWAEKDRDRYEHPALGFVLTKPADWHFLSTQQHRENLGRVEFSSEAFKRQVVEQSSAPLVVAMRHREPFSGLNPSLRVTVKPFGAATKRDPLAILGVILPGVARQLGGIEVIQPPAATTVAGLPAAHAVVHYTLRTTDGGEFATTSELWIVPNGDFYYVIGAGYAQDDEAIRTQVRDVVGTLAIRPAGAQ